MRDIFSALLTLPEGRFKEARISWFWSILDDSTHGYALLSSLPASVVEKIAASKVPVRLAIKLALTGDDEYIELANIIGKRAKVLTVKAAAATTPRFVNRIYDAWLSQPNVGASQDSCFDFPLSDSASRGARSGALIRVQ